MAQILLPVSDLSTGTWSSTPLWSKVDDDSTIWPSGDGVTIASDDNTAGDLVELELADGVDPGTTSGHILRVRWHKSGSGGHQVNADIGLIRRSDVFRVAQFQVTNIGNTEIESTHTLTESQVGNILDYGDLAVQITRNGDTGGNPNGRRSLVVDLVELEIPDAADPVPEGGSDAPVSITAQGAGAKEGAGGDGSSLSVTGEGAGTKQAQGGSTSDVDVVAVGGGLVGEGEPPEGGSVATVTLTAEGAGEKMALGGQGVVLSFLSEGAGQKAGFGGGGSFIDVSASGGGANPDSTGPSSKKSHHRYSSSYLRSGGSGNN